MERIDFRRQLKHLYMPSAQAFSLGDVPRMRYLYDDEAPTLARLHDAYLPQNGLIPNGRHHEIYIGDRRKAAPDKLKTVLRQPVKSAR